MPSFVLLNQNTTQSQIESCGNAILLNTVTLLKINVLACMVFNEVHTSRMLLFTAYHSGI